MERDKFFFEMKERCKVTCVKIFFVGIFGSQYLFTIYHTLVNIKNSENVV